MDSLFSHSWYRVKDLKPRLRSHVQIHRHTYRGGDWYVLQDHATGRFHRFSPEAYYIIGLMDGKRSLERIWETACESLGDDMPTQDEVIRLLSQLHSADALQSDMPPDISNVHQRSVRLRRSQWLSRIRSPLAVRIPILDPERFLAATEFAVRPLYGWFGFLAWCALVIWAVSLAGIHWDGLTSNLADRVMATENLFILWLIYPVLKLLHELGHAYTVKHWGGEVHEMGIMLLVFVPIPYVDASSASAFPGKRERIMVGAAGIMTEALFASIAMLVWVNVEPGAVRAAAFNVMIIAGVSTILFNGNPLLRFDAYYILSDYLEIPNLGSRANRHVGYLVQRYLLRLEEAQSPASAPGEALWLFVYAIGSFCYRLFITIRIALFVASKFYLVGMLLAIWGLASMLLVPFFKMLRHALTDPIMHQKRLGLLVCCGLAAALSAAVLLVFRFPSFTVAQGVLYAPDNSQVFAGADGFVARVVGVPGKRVERGELLILCENPDLDARVRVTEARLREFEFRHRLTLTRNRTEAEILKDEIERITAELNQELQEREALMIRSPGPGIFLLEHPEDLPGRFLARGTAVGRVVEFSKVTVRAVVPQEEVDRIRYETKGVTARSASRPGQVIPALMKREVPAATNELPSLALSITGGGLIALDPRESQTPKAFEKVFQFELLLPGLLPETIGERIYLRFEHEPEPLGFRWYRSIRRTLLSRFNI